MSFNVSLNLDDNLRQFNSLTFSKELIDNYYSGSELDYYPLVDNSNEYYEELLKTRYSTLYTLNKLVGNNKLTSADLYYVANNAYYMKGSEYSLKYALENIGIEVNDIIYKKSKIKYKLDEATDEKIVIPNSNCYNILLKVSLDVSSSDIELLKDYINKLAFELLFISSNELAFAKLNISLDINTEVIIKLSKINVNSLDTEKDLILDKTSEPYVPSFYYDQNIVSFNIFNFIAHSNNLNTEKLITGSIGSSVAEFVPSFYYNEGKIDIPLVNSRFSEVTNVSDDSDNYYVTKSGTDIIDYNPQFNID